MARAGKEERFIGEGFPGSLNAGMVRETQALIIELGRLGLDPEIAAELYQETEK